MSLLSSVLLAIVALLVVSSLYILSLRRSPSPPRKSKKHVLVVLGSGGHTGEMLSLLSSITSSPKYQMTFLISTGDSHSAALLLPALQSTSTPKILEIQRARRVGQSWLSTPWTSLLCFFACIRVVGEARPDVIVTNGPGSAVMVVYANLFWKVLMGRGKWKARTVFVESFARVKTLSLSGKLLRPVVDRFIVQWPGLAQTTAGAEYHGILVA